jgi:fructose-1,6-bisphosphatase I
MTPPPRNLQTVESHILQMQKLHPTASGEFTSLLNDLTFAAKLVARETTQAGLVDILGATGKRNVQGETVQKLDEFGNNILLRCIGTKGQVCALSSEEMAEAVFPDTGEGSGRYVVVFDPLDGSSNIDANVSVGTIFGIYRRISSLDAVSERDILQPGRDLAAAGYVIYGSSTMFVYTTGQGVHGFTLDPSIGEFLLSHENIRIPFEAKIYSVNEAYEPRWSPEIREVVRQLKYGRGSSPSDADSGKGSGMSSRYIGSLVADFHRNLLYGGVFLYPPTQDRPGGKLRLMCEAAPLAFLCENAGGYASDGERSILELEPTELHQRTPLYLGSRDTVLWIEQCLSRSQRGL